MLRRREGIRFMSLVVDRWPEMSDSVSSTSFAASSTKPRPNEARATYAMPGSGASSSSETRRTPRSAERSTSASRSAGPWPSVVSTTRQPSRSQRRTSPIILAPSPR